MLNSSRLKEFEDDNFTFDENGRKVFVMSNFSFSYSVFQRLVLQTRKNQGLFGKGLILPVVRKCLLGLLGPLGLNPTLHNLSFNSISNNKVLDWSKLKAHADDKINVTEKLKFALGRVENIVRNGENAGYQHFFLFLQCFQRPLFSRLLKIGIVW